MQPRAFQREDALYAIQKITDYFPNARISHEEMNQTFDQIVHYLQSCPAFRDPETKILIDKSGIYFGHNLNEIEASFPLLKRMLMSRTDKSFSEENLDNYSIQYKGIFVNTNWGNSNFDVKRRKKLWEHQNYIQEEAKIYFENRFNPVKNTRIIPSSVHSPDEAIMALTAQNQFVALGESIHGDRSGKKLLIDNMKELAELGVKAIFLEHVFADTQSAMLKNYLRSDSLEMPAMLKDYLEKLDRGFTKTPGFQPYSFTGLVMQAKKYGIEIIPIDTSASYMTDSSLALGGDAESSKRALMMNHVAAKQIQSYQAAHPSDKCIVLCGSMHLGSQISKVPGIAEITGGATVIVEDPAEHNHFKERIDVNPSHVMKPDMLVCMNTEMSRAAVGLMHDYNSIYQSHLEFIDKFDGLMKYYNSSLKESHSHGKDFDRLLIRMQNLFDFMSKQSGVTPDMILNSLAELINHAYLQEQKNFCKGFLGIGKKQPLDFIKLLNDKPADNHYARLLGLTLANIYESGKVAADKKIEENVKALVSPYNPNITNIFPAKDSSRRPESLFR